MRIRTPLWLTEVSVEQGDNYVSDIKLLNYLEQRRLFSIGKPQQAALSFGEIRTFLVWAVWIGGK